MLFVVVAVRSAAHRHGEAIRDLQPHALAAGIVDVRRDDLAIAGAVLSEDAVATAKPL